MGGALAQFLATERITRLVVEDKITEDLRYRVIGRFPNSKVSYLVTCPICVSVWAGFSVVALSKFRVGRSLVNALALSQATIYVRELQDG